MLPSFSFSLEAVSFLYVIPSGPESMGTKETIPVMRRLLQALGRVSVDIAAACSMHVME